MLTQDRRRARARLATASAKALKRPSDADAATAVSEARRDYWATALEDYISRVVAEAPPLTADQLDRLALLLRGGGTDG